MKEQFKQSLDKATAWICQERHRVWMRRQQDTVRRAFHDHPEEAGETYLEHLWFTVCMAFRFVYAGTVLLVHGIFPFLLTTTASSQIEKIYRIMKARIPKTRRDEIDDIDYTDYSV